MRDTAGLHCDTNRVEAEYIIMNWHEVRALHVSRERHAISSWANDKSTEYVSGLCSYTVEYFDDSRFEISEETYNDVIHHMSIDDKLDTDFNFDEVSDGVK